MSFMRKNWYYVGGGLCLALVVVLAIFWQDMVTLQKLMLVSFMALLVHQFEEYAWPGGFPAVMNIAWMPDPDAPSDRYPLNTQNSLFVNVFFAYPFYILPILFPGLIWLGLAQVLFGMAQFVVHGIVINRKLHTFYNPGLFAVVFLHWPIGLYYIWYIQSHGLVHWWTWPLAILLTAAAAFLMVFMPVRKWFIDRNSHYIWSAQMMNRFHVAEKVSRINKSAKLAQS